MGATVRSGESEPQPPRYRTRSFPSPRLGRYAPLHGGDQGMNDQALTLMVGTLALVLAIVLGICVVAFLG